VVAAAAVGSSKLHLTGRLQSLSCFRLEACFESRCRTFWPFGIFQLCVAVTDVY
jgi:hypothetical protein